jgi:hypothetical protein
MKKTILMLICLLIGSASIQAQSRSDESLQGLTNVRLVVQLFDRADAMEAEQRPIVLEMLQKDTEAKFTQAGIPLLKYNAPDLATFHILVTLDKPNGHNYPVRIDSKLFQSVRLSRKSSMEMSLSTWERSGVGGYDIKDLNVLRSDVGRLVDTFIKEYLIANPKSK